MRRLHRLSVSVVLAFHTIPMIAEAAVQPAASDRRVAAWSRVFPPGLVDRRIATEHLRVLVVPAGTHPQLASAATAVHAAFAGSARVDDVRMATHAPRDGDAEIVRSHRGSGLDQTAVVRVIDLEGRVRAIVTVYDAKGVAIAEIAGWADEPTDATPPVVAPPVVAPPDVAPTDVDPLATGPAPDGAGETRPAETVAPVPAATTVRPVRDDERPAPASPAGARKSGPEFDRIGVLGALSVGVESCAQPICALVPVGGIGRFELGYRYKWIAPVVSVSIGGAPVDLPEESTALPEAAPSDVSAALRFLDVGVGVQAFPISNGRIDPFLRIGLAYSRVALVVRDSESKYHRRFTRGGVQLGGGLSVYVARHVALGPRFDIVLPFAGKVCEELDGEAVAEDACTKTSDIVDEASSSIDERAIRRTFPKPWSVTFDVRFVF